MKCPHGKSSKYSCIDCSTKSICQHFKRKIVCKYCEPYYCKICEIYIARGHLPQHKSSITHIRQTDIVNSTLDHLKHLI